MGFLVLAVGVLLSAVGAYEIYYGNSVIAVERGWSAFIGGSVLFAGGIVTAAVGLAIHVLVDLRRLLAAAPGPVAPGTAALDAGSATFDAPHPDPELSAPVASLAAAVPPLFPATAEEPRPEPHPDRHGDAPPDTAPVPVDTYRDAAFERAAAEPASWRAEAALDATPPATEPREDADAPPTVPTLSGAADPTDLARPDRHDTPEAEPLPPTATTVATAAAAEPEPGAAAPEAVTVAAREAPASAVIGRYESEGTSYVMYADGSIDAQSSAGVYRFASMAELKRFIEG